MRELAEDTRDTQTRIDDVSARIDALSPRAGPDLCGADRVPPSSGLLRFVPSPHDSPDWGSLVSDARCRLAARGVDVDAVDLDAMLDPEEVSRIERRFRTDFTLRAHLDCYDVAAAVTAGLVAALVDFLIVQIPPEIVYLGHAPRRGSPLTAWLRSLRVPQDNWLARHFRTSYDQVQGISKRVKGFGPATHRLQTFGHDPLVGLVIGTIDIMRGSLTAVSKTGRAVCLPRVGQALYDPSRALVWEVMHLLSDGFTSMGLPPPGWSLLQLFRVGSFGEKKRTVADLARLMYRQGYDSRHFLTMATSTAAAEVVLRGYCVTRRALDEEYESAEAGSPVDDGRTSLPDRARYQGMALCAHGVACAANAGKVAVSGNPLTVNYAQWLWFIKAFLDWMQTGLTAPSRVLQDQARTNLRALETGWPELDVTSPSFPELVVT